jgi:hypothetical protein
MADEDSEYAELKPDIGLIANALFDVSKLFLRRQGNFLPHGAVLTRQGEVRMVAAAPESTDDASTSAEVLPVLHEGLRHQAKDASIKAIGTAESVTVTLENRKPAKAIKVLVEHERGLCVAVYLPFEKKVFRGYVMGSVFSRKASPEVKAWASKDA